MSRFLKTQRMQIQPSMLDPQKHRLKAERNEEFAAGLDNKDQIADSWAVVASFYSALHYVEAFFIAHGTVCHSHDERNDQFKNDHRINRAYPQYAYLSKLSHTARYKSAPLPDKAYENHARPQLLALKKQVDHAQKLIAQSNS